MKKSILTRQSLQCVAIILAALLFISNNTFAQDDPLRFEVGGQFSIINRNKPTPLTDVINDDDFNREKRYGFGARFTYNITNNIALEAEGNFFPKADQFIENTGPSGNIYRGQFGVKVGKRFSKFGIFGKARPGFVRFTQVSKLIGTRTVIFNNRQVTVGDFSVGKENYFSTDVGGVVEFYPSRRIVTRVDIGDTIIRYGTFRRAGFFQIIPIIERPAQTKHNLQFSVGLGFRF